MLCATVAGSGEVIATSEAPPDCSGVVLFSTADYDRLRNPFTATPDFSIVSWAVGATLLMFAVGFAVGMFISLVRKTR